MYRTILFILICVLAANPAGGKTADGPGPSAPAPAERRSAKPPYGGIARQKLLKFRLRMVSEGTLTASLDHNFNEWESLSPDQRERYRRNALAFLRKNPEQQEKLLKHYEKLIKMDVRKREAYRRRAKWLKVVVRSFTPDERKALLELDPDQRARRLIERRDKLVSEGKLKIEKVRKPDESVTPRTKPATTPAEADKEPPATQPAEKPADKPIVD